MILIGGTTLKVDELPMHEIMEYQIESGKPLEIKLKTIAKKPECFAVYLHESQRAEVTIVDEIVDADLLGNSHISYAGVEKIDDKLMATGGRVLVCVGFGKSIKEARDRAYALCGQVHFAGKKCRSDIAYQALK